MKIISTLRTAAVCCALLLGACENVTAAPTTKVITTRQQGIHEWPAFGGKLVLLVGTLTDTTSYKQSFTFYMATTGQTEWLHVPVKEASGAYTVSWMNINEGDAPELDAVVVVQDKQTFLIVAGLDRKNGGISAQTFKFIQNGTDVITEPTFMFKQLSTTPYKQAKLSVEDVLKKEAQRKLTK